MPFEGIIAGIISPLVVILLVNALLSKLRASKAPLPPRPKPHFFVGNLFDLTGDVKEDCKRYHEWCKELETDILYLNVLGTSMIVLDSYEASWELLDKRSSIYSGRAKMPMITELMGWDFDFAFMDYGDTWRRHRKLMHQHFNATAVKDFIPQQVKAAHGLVKRLLDGPNDVVKAIRQMSGEIIISITYGLEVQPSNDPYIQMAEAGVQPLLEASVPGAFLVDTFPFFKYIPSWFPGAEFKRKAREWRKLARSMVDIPFAATMEAMNKGTANPSFVMKCLDDVNMEDKNAKEEDIKSVAGTLYQAGSDTTTVTLAYCILTLLEHPDVIKKAQQEIDSVSPPGSFPDFRDEESLPYITAIVKEILRWQVIGPIGVPHTSSSDDIYNGYLIPAGSTLIPNVWAILHDEKVFPDHESFVPERFMKYDEVAEARLEVSWGYGRRVCSGRYMAFSTVWIALASILAVYDISKPLDENGHVIEPSHEYSSSILPCPSPFKAVFKPRNKAAEDLIKSGFGIQESY
ncbi:cytochrome P450 [Cyathus striatus]|nr:cytochrome P450 [Cyathus striatus]